MKKMDPSYTFLSDKPIGTVGTAGVQTPPAVPSADINALLGALLYPNGGGGISSILSAPPEAGTGAAPPAPPPPVFGYAPDSFLVPRRATTGNSETAAESFVPPNPFEGVGADVGEAFFGRGSGGSGGASPLPGYRSDYRGMPTGLATAPLPLRDSAGEHRDARQALRYAAIASSLAGALGGSPKYGAMLLSNLGRAGVLGTKQRYEEDYGDALQDWQRGVQAQNLAYGRERQGAEDWNAGIDRENHARRQAAQDATDAEYKKGLIDDKRYARRQQALNYLAGLETDADRQAALNSGVLAGIGLDEADLAEVGKFYAAKKSPEQLRLDELKALITGFKDGGKITPEAEAAVAERMRTLGITDLPDDFLRSITPYQQDLVRTGLARVKETNRHNLNTEQQADQNNVAAQKRTETAAEAAQRRAETTASAAMARTVYTQRQAGIRQAAQLAAKQAGTRSAVGQLIGSHMARLNKLDALIDGADKEKNRALNSTFENAGMRAGAVRDSVIKAQEDKIRAWVAEEDRISKDLARAIAEYNAAPSPPVTGAGGRRAASDQSRYTESYEGGLKPHVAAARDEISFRFGISDIGGYRRDAIDPNGHPAGKALDVMVNQDRAKGDTVAAYAIQNAQRLGAKYVIWQQRINHLDGKGWHAMKDRGDPTANHMDHVHISFKDAPGGEGPAPVRAASVTEKRPRPALRKPIAQMTTREKAQRFAELAGKL